MTAGACEPIIARLDALAAEVLNFAEYRKASTSEVRKQISSRSPTASARLSSYATNCTRKHSAWQRPAGAHHHVDPFAVTT